MKIAVCFSGEVRGYNDGNTYEAWKSLKEQFESLDEYHKISFYGHTWSHCEEPIQYLDFEEIKITDQKEIDDFVLENLLFRSVNKEEWLTDYDFRSMSNDELISHYLEGSRRGYGQLVSAIESFKLVPEEDKNWLIIRTRWDTQINEEYIQSILEMFEDIRTEKWPYGHSNENMYLMNCSVLRFNNNDWFSSPEDIFFIMRSCPKIWNLIKNNVYDAIDEIIVNTPPDKSTPTSHTIWNRFFSHYDVTAIPTIDYRFARLYRDPNMDTKKYEWNI